MKPITWIIRDSDWTVPPVTVVGGTYAEAIALARKIANDDGA